MSTATVDIDGESTLVEEAENMDVTVTFEESDGYQCEHCRESIEEGDGVWSVDNVSRHRSDTYCEERFMSESDGEETEPDPDLDEDEERAELTRAKYVHEPAQGGIDEWVNGAGVSVDRDGNQVDVWISLGDPRGAFMMRAERLTYTNDDGVSVTEIRLSVPHPSKEPLHLPLSNLASKGYYRVGN